MEDHEHEGINAEISNLKESDIKQWDALDKLRDAIDKLRNRLPLWATFMIGGLMSTVTGLIVRSFNL